MKNKEQAIQVRCLPEFKLRIKNAANHYNLSVSGYLIMLINQNLKELGK